MAHIKIKSAAQIEQIKQACSIVAWVLLQIKAEIKPGITTLDLDKFADELIRKQGGEPVFVGYRGYKHATCLSVNEEVVHGIPSQRALVAGDIIGVDVGAKINGYCGDTAATFPVGEVSKKAARLIRATKEALRSAIAQARAGNHLGDISAAIYKVAEQNGCSVVRDLYGHGIGSDLHEEPLIPNFGRPGEGPELKPGMTLAIEPMLNLGGSKIRTLADGWTVVTDDGALSCHFEHTVLVRGVGPEILTKQANL